MPKWSRTATTVGAVARSRASNDWHDDGVPVAPTPARRGVDPLTVLVLAALGVGLVAPARGAGASGLDVLRGAAVVLLFFLYGVRLAGDEVAAAVRGWRLQSAVLVATFVLFPLLGLAASALPGLDATLRTGVLYLTLMPSTVQSSIVLTSIARGNVAGAITAATVSNVLGIGLTPLLTAALLGSSGGLGAGGVVGTLTQLLLPFALGQVARRGIGGWVRAHRHVTVLTDRGTIVLVVYASVSEATVAGAWSHLRPAALLGLIAVAAALLAVMLTATWFGGRRIGLDRPDRVALLMCGSKKSLATGLPMASVLFTPAVAAGVALPVIVFHQLQLLVCAALARRLAANAPPPEVAEH